jgi:DNA-binding NtrC family response regulator
MTHVLIVDDNRPFAENLAEILEDAGMRVAVADGGARALALVEAERFDVLLSDMRMPVMGGAELVHRIRKVDPGLPAVVITAHTDDADLAAARREGLLAVLPKPVPVPQLLELVRSARRGGLVALVEDDPSFADNLSEALRARGLAAVTARSVLEVQQMTTLEPFAAIVDLRVPGGPDGAAAQGLRDRFPDLPIIVVSGHGDIPSPTDLAARFTKPPDMGGLIGVLDDLYHRRHA